MSKGSTIGKISASASVCDYDIYSEVNLSAVGFASGGKKAVCGICKQHL